MKNKAQAWGLDIIVAASIFAVGIVTFYFYAINYSNQSQEIYQDLSYQGEKMADALLSTGYPENWNSTNVVTPGILTNSKVNNTKLENLYILANSNHNNTKSLLNINYNFYFNFSEPIIISGTHIQGIGEIYTNSHNLIKITRLTTYNNKPVSLNIYVWN